MTDRTKFLSLFGNSPTKSPIQKFINRDGDRAILSRTLDYMLDKCPMWYDHEEATLTIQKMVDAYNDKFEAYILRELEGWWRVAGHLVNRVYAAENHIRPDVFNENVSEYFKIRREHPRYHYMMMWFADETTTPQWPIPGNNGLPLKNLNGSWCYNKFLGPRIKIYHDGRIGKGEAYYPSWMNFTP